MVSHKGQIFWNKGDLCTPEGNNASSQNRFQSTKLFKERNKTGGEGGGEGEIKEHKH